MIEFQMYTLLMNELNSINISKGSGKKYCLPVAGQHPPLRGVPGFSASGPLALPLGSGSISCHALGL